ncbi:MAG: DNA-binding NarL/FixJ family response regulator [Bacteroidia bacterium]|jgi:DNA-binding NarL/FixJ family response regulator
MQSKKLSPAESRIFEVLLHGKENKVVADELCIQVKTVEKHITRILAKNEARSVKHLLGKYIQGELCKDCFG